MRTAAVKRIVEIALESLPRPYTEDVIDDVFYAIEQRPEWRQAYDDLCSDLGSFVVNTTGGAWIKKAVGGVAVEQVPTWKSTRVGPAY